MVSAWRMGSPGRRGDSHGTRGLAEHEQELERIDLRLACDQPQARGLGRADHGSGSSALIAATVPVRRRPG